MSRLGHLGSLRGKVLATYAILFLVTMSLSLLYLRAEVERFYERQLGQDLVAQGRLLAPRVQPFLRARDPAGLAALLRAVASETDARVLVFDARGVLLGTTKPDDTPPVGQITNLPGLPDALRGREASGQRFLGTGSTEVAYVTTPVEENGQVIGAVRVSYPLAALYAFERALAGRLALAGALVTAVIALLGFFFAGTITRPLREVRDAVGRLALGELTARVPVRGTDEVAQVAADINALAERLAALEEERSRFASEVSHDIRSLSAGIALTAQVLQRLDPARQERALQLLRALTGQSARLATLADELALVANLDTVERAPKLQVARLDQVVTHVVGELQPRAEAAGLTLDYVPPADPVRAPLDEALFPRALVNLLTNAITYTPAGGLVRIGLALEGNRVALTVADTGPGIPPEERVRLFEYGYRGAAGRRRAGYGLGLAIVKRITKLHGGEVRVASEPGEGTTFTLLLPLETTPPDG